MNGLINDTCDKVFFSDMGMEITNEAIQIFGGAAIQIKVLATSRDNRINPFMRVRILFKQ